MIELIGFDTANRVIRGRIELTADRLTDRLGAGDALLAHDVIVRHLATGATEEHQQVLVETRDLLVVVATGPRGSTLRRIPVATCAATILVGRYMVHGVIHAPSRHDPVRTAESRLWLPVTEAVLEQHAAGRPDRHRFDTLLVNRMHTTAIMRIDEGAHETHWLAARVPRGLVATGFAAELAR